MKVADEASSQSSRSKLPSSRRLTSSNSSGSVKEFTVFGDDLVVQGSGHSSASLKTSVHSQLVLTREAKSDVAARDSAHSLGSRPAKDRASPVTRSKAKSIDDANADSSSRHSSTKTLSRGDSSKRSSIEAFTVSVEQTDFRVPSRESSDAGGNSRHSSHRN